MCRHMHTSCVRCTADVTSCYMYFCLFCRCLLREPQGAWGHVCSGDLAAWQLACELQQPKAAAGPLSLVRRPSATAAEKALNSRWQLRGSLITRTATAAAVHSRLTAPAAAANVVHMRHPTSCRPAALCRAVPCCVLLQGAAGSWFQGPCSSAGRGPG